MVSTTVNGVGDSSSASGNFRSGIVPIDSDHYPDLLGHMPGQQQQLQLQQQLSPSNSSSASVRHYAMSFKNIFRILSHPHTAFIYF